MHILLKRVRHFTQVICTTQEHPDGVAPDILSLRRLRNKVTPTTEPVITVDHKQTAMLALINGVRTGATLAKPMPAGYLNDPEGGSYGNDSDYDARQWGHEEPNASLSYKDFAQLHSLLVRKKISELVLNGDRSSVIEQGFHPTRLEKIEKRLLALKEQERQEELACLMKNKSLTICMCGDACDKGTALCPSCREPILRGELIKPTTAEGEPSC